MLEVDKSVYTVSVTIFREGRRMAVAHFRSMDEAQPSIDDMTGDGYFTVEVTDNSAS